MDVSRRTPFSGRISGAILLAAAMLMLTACGSDTAPTERFYTMDDYPSVEKIDIHVHWHTADTAFMAVAREDNFRLLTINTDYGDFPPIAEQLDLASAHHQAYPERLAFASTFPMSGWDDAGWEAKTIDHLDRTIAEGAVAVKVWKNIGMGFKDADGENVMIDDPGFDPVFDHIRDRGVVLIGHQGEPKNCWLPLEEMTVNNDRGYFKNHPQYHMYLHPEEPSYETHMQVRDRMLAKNPELRFMGAHLASLEWSVDSLAAFLDRYPNAVVDMAARMGQVQYQSSQDREKVRQFLIDYQDRVLYATDLTVGPDDDPATFRAQAHKKWMEDWQYLTTDDTMTVPELDGEFQGLKLPADVVDKIYHVNARKFYPGSFGQS